jgi:hypothetical protein
VLGQRDPAADRVAERGQAEDADRQPQLQRARPARELHRAVAEVDLAGERVAQVGALERERALEQRRLAHQQAADLVGLEQPLVRVEHQRVGALQPGQQRAGGRPQRGRRAVGAVHVQPQVLLGADVGQRVERVDRARARGAGRGHDAHRPAPRRAVGRDRRPHRPGIQPEPGIGLQHPELLEAEHAQRPRHGGVRLVGAVDDARPARGAGGGQPHQIRDRAARGQHALGAFGQPAQLAQPVEHHELDGRRPRAAGPGAGEDVEPRGGRVGEHADVVARAPDAREEARMVAELDERQHLVEEPVELGLGVAGLLRRRPAEALAQRFGVTGAHRRQLAELLEVLHDPVDHAVAEAAHVLGRQRQGAGHTFLTGYETARAGVRSWAEVRRAGWTRGRSNTAVRGPQAPSPGARYSHAPTSCWHPG